MLYAYLKLESCRKLSKISISHLLLHPCLPPVPLYLPPVLENRNLWEQSLRNMCFWQVPQISYVHITVKDSCFVTLMCIK